MAVEFNAALHHRRSIRLRDYDYSQAGAYFVTLCAKDRECLFGDLAEGDMRLTDAGQVVQDAWDALPDHCAGIDLDAFVIMPNHVHGIIVINDNAVRATHELPESDDARVGAIHELPQSVRAIHESPLQGSFGRQHRQMLLPKIIGRFKMNTAKHVNQIRETPGVPVWQPNYYEHIIRNEESLNRIREYIAYNPAQWIHDRENPVGVIRELPLQQTPNDEPWRV